MRSSRWLARRAPIGALRALECLEERSLQAATGTAFVFPNVGTVAASARRGARNTPALVTILLTALQSQTTRGPLANLATGAVDGNGFVSEVSSLVASFDARVARRLGRVAPRLVNLLD